jgi:hypothetical protein
MKTIGEYTAEYKVYIVESPRDIEILHDIGEAEIIKGVLKQFGIKSKSFLAVNKSAFRMSMDLIAKDIKDIESEASKKIIFPYIHISCHGTKDGLQLTMDSLSWYDVAENINIINQKIGYLQEGKSKFSRLAVSLSACEGIWAREILNQGFPDSYAALLGCNRKPTWAETTAAFTSFYFTLIFRERNALEAVVNMNASIGEKDLFTMETGTGLRNHLAEKKMVPIVDAINGNS